MKISIKIAAVALMLGFAFQANAQSDPVEGTATASATIIEPLAIEWVADMNFGDLAVSATTSGELELTPDGVRNPSGGVQISAAAAGTVSPAEFDVTGSEGYLFTLTLPSELIITEAVSAQTMTIDGFTSSLLDDSAAALDVNGAANFTIGATLNVTAAQATGLYTSVDGLVVAVNYN